MESPVIDKIGILLMEEPDGNMAVELYSDPDDLAGRFDNLKGRPADEPSRATFIKLSWEGGQANIEAISKDLPVPAIPAEDRPDAWRLGEGPVDRPVDGKLED